MYCVCVLIMKVLLCVVTIVGYVSVVRGQEPTFVQLYCAWEHARSIRDTDVTRETHLGAALRRQKRHAVFHPAAGRLFIHDQHGRIRRSVVESAIRNGNLDILLSRRKRSWGDYIPDPIQTTTLGDTIAERSLCPWSLVQDTNSTRIPRRMMKAICDNSGGGQHGTQCQFPFPPEVPDSARTEMYASTTCLPVMEQLEVVVECCNNGHYSWHFELIDWQVSCACARRGRS